MGKQNQKFIKKLKNRYRLVMINDTTFEDKFSFSLTPLNVFIGFSSFLVFFTCIIVLLIVFTPLKEFIPGYTDSKSRQQLAKLLTQTDSLETALQNRDQYYKNILHILTDTPDSTQITKPSKQIESIGKDNDISKSASEKAFAKEFESQKDTYNTKMNSKASASSVLMFKPVKGIVTTKYNGGSHLGIDIAAKEQEPVKAVLDGKVVFTSWTKESGYVVVLQHARNMISIYKHSAGLLKKTDTFVRAGETIAIVGNTGEHANGYHLHLEIWENGRAVNPLNYLTY